MAFDETMAVGVRTAWSHYNSFKTILLKSYTIFKDICNIIFKI